MTVKEILPNLKIADRDALMVAFEELRTYFIEYEEGKYIGVHMDESDGRKVEDVAGHFSSGLILGTKNETS